MLEVDPNSFFLGQASIAVFYWAGYLFGKLRG